MQRHHAARLAEVRPQLECALAPFELARLTDGFLATAAAYPARRALVCAGEELSYGELDRQSAELAGLLRAHGLVAGDVLGIVAERGPLLVIAMLATLRAGGIFCVLSAAYPDARIRSCLALAGAKLVLRTDAGGEREALAPQGVRVLRVDLPGFAALTAGYALPPLSPTDHLTPAYLMFTSGSTGEPKCVATGHAPLPHFLRWQRETFALHPQMRFALLAGLSHDPLLRDVFGPLSMGAELHIPPEGALADPEALLAFLASSRISVVHLTPPLGRILDAAPEGQVLPDLTVWFWGGDALHRDLVRALCIRAPRARHVNFYGTTETPQAVAFCEVDPDATAGRIPIGRGVRDFELVVLDAAGELAEVGALGELHVRSRYLSLGYWRGGLTASDRYVLNRGTGEPDDRLYRTGDLAVYLPDGTVALRGRADDQVKVRGHRVELGDVTAQLLESGLLREVSVLSRRAPDNDVQIVAYAVPRDPEALTAGDLRVHAAEALPAHMRPHAYVLMPQLPRLHNGKIDRRALLDAAPGTAEGATEEGSERERALGRLWSDALGLPYVGLHESFYALGGDSLTAVRVMMRMRGLGLDDATCRGLLHGHTIAEIVHGDVSSERASAQQLQLVLNVVRGLLVVLLVADHWFDGLASRSAALRTLQVRLGPLLNWPTPGFAMAFGLTCACVYLPLYAQQPRRAVGLMRRGGLMVGGAALALGLVHLGWLACDLAPWLAGSDLGARLAPFDHVLLYYAAALFSGPLWLAWLAPPHTVPRALASALLLIAAYGVTIVWLGPPDSAPWWLDVALGKYSYPNLTAGAFLGIAAGTLFRTRGGIPPSTLRVGVALMALGALASFAPTDGGLFTRSTLVEPWKWAFYGGVMLLAVFGVDRALASGSPRMVRVAVLFGLVGQLAFPLVFLDFFARDVGLFANLTGLRWLRFAGAFFLFAAGSTWLLRRAYTLYVGPVREVAQPARIRG